jgi:glycosyltransferase involved in cell wall biosynthesis
MNPFDIVIIPYEHDTGMRTKLPLFFNYAQVVVATEASVAGSPEIKPGENCIILPGLEGFPEALIKLSQDAGLREKIGQHARETFESEFVLENQLPIYKQLISHMR